MHRVMGPASDHSVFSKAPSAQIKFAEAKHPVETMMPRCGVTLGYQHLRRAAPSPGLVLMRVHCFSEVGHSLTTRVSAEELPFQAAHRLSDGSVSRLPPGLFSDIAHAHTGRYGRGKSALR